MPFNYGNYRHKSTCGLRNQEADVSKHGGKYECEVCGRKFKNRQNKFSHMKTRNTKAHVAKE